jgi:hypothetical protein
MSTRLTLISGIIGVLAVSAVTSLIPIHQVNAQVIPDLTRGSTLSSNDSNERDYLFQVR